MSDEHIKEVKEGIEALHQKIADHGKESSDVKSLVEKLGESVKAFEAESQASKARADGDAERLAIVEAHLAKSKGGEKVDAKEVRSALAYALKTVDVAGQEVDFKSLLTKSRTVTDGQSGGFYVDHNMVSAMMLTYMRDENPMLRESTVVNVKGSGGIQYPVNRVTFGASAAGELEVGRGKTKRNIELRTITMGRYLSQDAITEELLAMQTIESENSVAQDILADLGWTMQYDALRGSGSGSAKILGLLNEPFLLSTAHTSSGQAGAPTKPTWKDLYEVQANFNYERYRNNGKFFFNYNTLVSFLTEVDSEGRPLYMPAINGAMSSTIAGKPFVIMPDMDSALASNTMPVLFGDMKKAYVFVMNNEFRSHRVMDKEAMEKGLITVGISTFGGGAVHDEEAIRSIKGA
jgi:HK97 family phage major capsid protein